MYSSAVPTAASQVYLDFSARQAQVLLYITSCSSLIAPSETHSRCAVLLGSRDACGKGWFTPPGIVLSDVLAGCCCSKACSNRSAF